MTEFERTLLEIELKGIREFRPSHFQYNFLIIGES